MLQSDFNWGLFLQPTPFGHGIYLDWLLKGMLLTVTLSICAWILAFIIGSIIGVMRTLPYTPAKAIGRIYVEVFRNIPLIVQFFIWYLVAPHCLPEPLKTYFLSDLDPQIQIFITSVSCLSFFTAARIAEQVRTGIETLPSGQKSAGLALGLTLFQTYRYILLPNGYRRIIPPLTSEMTSLVKNSSIASTIGLLELMVQANRLVEYSSYTIESYIGITLAYVVINLVIMFLMRLIENKMRLPRQFGG